MSVERFSSWYTEGLFKEWKSYANFHAFDTTNPAIVAGLLWAAIAAAALKRFLAYMTQILAAVPRATRKGALGAGHVVGEIVQACKAGDVGRLSTALETAITYLACHAQRAHPKRDRATGRSQLGLEPRFGNDDAIELAKAAEVLTYVGDIRHGNCVFVAIHSDTECARLGHG